jgi:hypothetical protein
MYAATLCFFDARCFHVQNLEEHCLKNVTVFHVQPISFKTLNSTNPIQSNSVQYNTMSVMSMSLSLEQLKNPKSKSILWISL